jgi:hypothetical protein
VLLGVSLLDITLSYLLHHEVGINLHVLNELAASNAPLAGDGKDANWRLSVDQGINTRLNVGESESVCGLKVSRLEGGYFEVQEVSYLANWLLVGNRVCGLGFLITGNEVVADERWTESLDHQVVIVQSRDGDSGVDASKRSGDVGGRHLEVKLKSICCLV